MELCQSSLLDEISAQDGIGPVALKQLIQCFKEGFKCMLKHDIVHCDIKPANILTLNGVYKITDFGLSMFAKPDQKLQMASGSFYHCHPDVFKAVFWSKIGLVEMPKDLLPREIDLYSIGVTLFQSISNKLPFIASEHKSMYELISEKPKDSVRGVEVNGCLLYEDRLPKCTLYGDQEKEMTQMLIRLLKVTYFHAYEFFKPFM